MPRAKRGSKEKPEHGQRNPAALRGASPKQPAAPVTVIYADGSIEVREASSFKRRPGGRVHWNSTARKKWGRTTWN